MSRGARGLFLGALALAACARFRAEPTSDDGRDVRRTAEPLIAESERLTGADLPDMHLILTFDDAPVSMDVTGAISTYLSTRPTPIHGTFFVDGSCVAATTLPNPICATPTVDGTTVLAKLTSDGHLIGNHTTTARDLVTTVPVNQLVQEVSETDAVIAPYVPWNRKVFRAPNGSWIGSDAGADAVYETLHGSAFDDYIGPIAWNIQTDDASCWSQGLTAQQCGDLYRAEIHARGNGIVRFHDGLATIGLLHYLIPLLESDGYTFDDFGASRALSALFPICDPSCATCTGPATSDCATCATGQRLVGGACATCALCPAGTFTTSACSASADTQCEPCEAGTYNPSAGALGCAACLDGCDDENPCTIDQCSPSQGCVHTRLSSCGGSDASIDNDAAIPPLGATGREAGPPVDDEANVAADMSGSDSGCRTAPGRSGVDGGLVIAVAILVSLRRRDRTRSITV